MGLDMYAYKVAKAEQNTEISLDVETILDGEFFYWRKNNALHGWMEQLYNEKGGTETFNCESVLLTKEDLLRLKKDIKKGLTPKEGFFFGLLEYTDDDKERDLAFVTSALETLKVEDVDIYYSSWW